MVQVERAWYQRRLKLTHDEPHSNVAFKRYFELKLVCPYDTEANFNPLAGCLPTFATLPVFIGEARCLVSNIVDRVKVTVMIGINLVIRDSTHHTEVLMRPDVNMTILSGIHLESNQTHHTNECMASGCHRTLFIGLYRALSNAATEGVLTQGFFWIPSLGRVVV